MALTDQQVDQLLGQYITQHEAERAGHQANIAKLGVLLEASVPESPAEERFIAEIEATQQTIGVLDNAIAELAKIASKPNSAQRLKARADEVVALAVTRKRNRPPEPQQEQPDVTPGPGQPPRR